MNHIKLGEFGEREAAIFLSASGYKILAQNFRSKTGEIDIIAAYKDIIVFVEVKTRRNTLFGQPSEAVTYSKQQKLLKTALCYLKLINKPDSACRFDVLEVLMPARDDLQINHITNAFGS